MSKRSGETSTDGYGGFVGATLFLVVLGVVAKVYMDGIPDKAEPTTPPETTPSTVVVTPTPSPSDVATPEMSPTIDEIIRQQIASIACANATDYCPKP